MTATRLKRKDRKNLARAVNKTRVIKQLLARPVIKNVNLEELNAKYGTVASAPKAEPKAAKAEPQAETPAASTEETTA